VHGSSANPRRLLIDTPAPAFHTLSLHDALPISLSSAWLASSPGCAAMISWCAVSTRCSVTYSSATGCSVKVVPRSPGDHCRAARSEEHTSELQSRGHLVCRLLVEKKNSH